MRKQKGFSLIELLLVVAVILIIAAIAVPNLQRARIAANEASAVSSIRTINTAEVLYNTSYPTVGYSANLDNLGGTSCNSPSSTSACLIEATLAAGTKSGYTFTYTVGGNNPQSGQFTGGNPATSFQLMGDPLVQNQTGVRHFCSYEDAVVRHDPSAVIATCDSTVAALQ